MVRSALVSTSLLLAPLVWGQGPTAAEVLLGLQQGGSYLGVGVIDVNQAAASRVGLSAPLGVEIANVAEDSPAAQAGLERRDVVTKFRGEEIQGVEHFVRLVRETPVGREVEMEVASAKGKRTVKAVIGERAPVIARMPAPEVRMRLSEPVDVDIPRPTMLLRSRFFGATLESIDGQFAAAFGVSEGVLVREVEAGQPAEQAGLQAGDVIVSIEGSPVRRTTDIRMGLGRAKGETAKLEVMRNKVRKQFEIHTGRRTMTQPFQGARSVSRPNRDE
jgi:S1-C subfamily serine protease